MPRDFGLQVVRVDQRLQVNRLVSADPGARPRTVDAARVDAEELSELGISDPYLVTD